MQSWAWQRKSVSGKEGNLFRQLGTLIPTVQRIGHYWRTHSVLPPSSKKFTAKEQNLSLVIRPRFSPIGGVAVIVPPYLWCKNRQISPLFSMSICPRVDFRHP